jgi:hypothetical protein
MKVSAGTKPKTSKQQKTRHPAANQIGPETPKLNPTIELPSSAVDQSQLEMTTEAVNPVPTDRLATMNIFLGFGNSYQIRELEL